MAPTAEKLTFIGSFASDTLANTEITNQDWYKRKALVYWNSVILEMRYWNGSAWKSFGGGGGLMARMYKAADQSLPDNAWTNLTFDSSNYDTGSLIGANKFVIPTGGDGVYSLKCCNSFRPDVDGRRGGLIKKNGTTIDHWKMKAETSLPGLTIAHSITDYKLIAGDDITFRSWHNAGAALNSVGGTATHWASIHRIGDG